VSLVSGAIIQVARKLRRNQTKSERLIWQKVRNRKLKGKKFIRQHPIRFTSGPSCTWVGNRGQSLALCVYDKRGNYMRSDYKIYDKQGIYFITSTIIEWIPIFTSKKYFEILTSSLIYCQEYKNLEIYAYVILDNHFHMICQGLELSSTIQSLKRHTAKLVVTQLKEDNKTWILNLLSFYKKKHKLQSKHQIWQESMYP